MSDIGPGDELECIKDFAGFTHQLVIGRTYICERLIVEGIDIPKGDLGACIACGDDSPVAILLEGIPDAGWCFCGFRKKGGGSELSLKFVTELLKPVHITPDRVKEPT